MLYYKKFKIPGVYGVAVGYLALIYFDLVASLALIAYQGFYTGFNLSEVWSIGYMSCRLSLLRFIKMIHWHKKNTCCITLCVHPLGSVMYCC